MSNVNKILAKSLAVFKQTGHLDDFTVLSGAQAGQVFYGTLDSEEAVVFDGLVGPDPRMQTVVRIARPSIVLEANDMFTDGTNKWKVLKFDNNAAELTNAYYVEQQL